MCVGTYVNEVNIVYMPKNVFIEGVPVCVCMCVGVFVRMSVC